jgi:hypothetical protein
MCCPNVAAIDPHRDWTIRQWLLLPIFFRTFAQIELSLLSQFLLDPLRRRIQMVPYGFLIERIAHR